jgi:hypothetical protein
MQDEPQPNTAVDVESVSGRLHPRTDLFVGLGLILFGSVAAFESWRMPRFEHLDVQIYQAPGFVPGLLGLTIAVFGLLILIRSLREGALQWKDAHAAQALRTMVASIETWRLVMLMVITVGYAWGLVGRMPFWLATIIFVFAFILLFDWRDAVTRSQRVRLLISASIQAVITAVVVTGVFQEIFRVRLP